MIKLSSKEIDEKQLFINTVILFFILSQLYVKYIYAYMTYIIWHI